MKKSVKRACNLVRKLKKEENLKPTIILVPDNTIKTKIMKKVGAKITKLKKLDETVNIARMTRIKIIAVATKEKFKRLDENIKANLTVVNLKDLK